MPCSLWTKTNQKSSPEPIPLGLVHEFLWDSLKVFRCLDFEYLLHLGRVSHEFRTAGVYHPHLTRCRYGEIVEHDVRCHLSPRRLQPCQAGTIDGSLGTYVYNGVAQKNEPWRMIWQFGSNRFQIRIYLIVFWGDLIRLC